MEPAGTGPRRRSILAAIASGSVAAAAGCLGGSEPDEKGTEGHTVEEPSFPEHPGDEPRASPAGRRCDGPCGMEPADYPEWNAQIAHANGDGVFFDTPGCLVAYRHDPTFYGGPESPIGMAWVRDFGTGEPVDAAEAAFVLDYDEERFEEPMAHNPKPFADRADAVEYVGAHDDLDAGAIVGIDAFGAEQANRYRDYPIPEE